MANDTNEIFKDVFPSYEPPKDNAEVRNDQVVDLQKSFPVIASLYDKYNGKEPYMEIYEKFSRMLSQREQYSEIPENPFSNEDTGEEPYREVLKPYRNVIVLDKTKFIEEFNPNIGWKIHLNVEPRDTKKVSEYLLNNGYCHKYLSGGAVEDGKIFTVYLGDYSLARKMAEEVSRDLRSFLRKPKAFGEVALADGIVGRFCYFASPIDDIEIASYGTLGFSNIKTYLSFNSRYRKTIEIATLGLLYDKYGKYFIDVISNSDFTEIWRDTFQK